MIGHLHVIFLSPLNFVYTVACSYFLYGYIHILFCGLSENTVAQFSSFFFFFSLFPFTRWLRLLHLGKNRIILFLWLIFPQQTEEDEMCKQKKFLMYIQICIFCTEENSAGDLYIWVILIVGSLANKSLCTYIHTLIIICMYMWWVIFMYRLVVLYFSCWFDLSYDL